MTEPTKRIEEALARLGAEHQPPEGWEERVLQVTRSQPPRSGPRIRWRWWWITGPVVLAAAGLLVFLGTRSHPEERELALRVVVSKQGQSLGVDTAKAGDLVRAQATGGGRYRAVRIYRNGDFELACPGQSPCHDIDGEITVEIPLTSVGTYRIVALSSSSPLPPTTGHVDGDMAELPDEGVTKKDQKILVK